MKLRKALLLLANQIQAPNGGSMKPEPSVELLAPAGGWPQLRAGLNAGADAVFFGTGSLNMRARAKNFDPTELPEVVHTCREKNAKAYLTLNTLVKEEELAELDEVVHAAKLAGVDAVIAADFAVIRAAKRHRMPVHLSTQMSVGNSESLKFFFEMGIRRAVMARESTLEELRIIKADKDLQEMEIEVFGHGAMCVAVSGRCFMSGFVNGRSANRGECSQPCRREYYIQSDRGGAEFTLSGQNVLSPKDLCTLPFIEQLLDAGIRSLKIEGRNRSPDYVHTVITAYRRAVDFYQENRKDPEFLSLFEPVKQKGMNELEKVYHRGFSEGFYMGKPLGDWTTEPGNQSSHRREYIGQILQMDPSGDKVTVRLESAGLRKGEEIFAESPETGFLQIIPEELEQDGKKVSSAEKGSLVDLIRKPFMHKGLKFYKLSPR